MIDHHLADDIEARFVDHRVEIGAAATILTEYVRAFDFELDSILGTALLFAIRRETHNFLRGTTREEYEAAGYLHDHAYRDLLRQLVSPSVTGANLDAIATAISHQLTTSAVLISPVGRTSERDAVPQAADYLATLEGVSTVVIFGIVEDAIHHSARSPDPRVHVGDVLRAAFDDIGSAGGHHDIAGGELPLGILADYTTDDEQLLPMLEQVITARLLAELNRIDESEM